ncbi:efflux RND transporter periplasmic adaptor subunit [Anaeromyxobacter soli]|uniref:efflux RND transporter periplasmic adaptor subunit n=2 Tax=Anaeromyxobacter TaxID=161492 RepID=UPI001FB01ACE|nr:efflux RND transporter periplasmic adaptor subunit [Anaeromyxobacter sp. SG29]
MNTETNHPSPAHRRTFGLPALVLAVLATAAVAGGAGFFVATRGTGDGHAHAGAATAAKEQWQCPMHPSIVQDHPGDCPICGMKLVKVEAAGAGAAPKSSAPTAPQKDQWQCPMHPSIVQDHPGDCPICGMKLVKVEGTGAGAGEPDEPAPEGLSAVTIDAARQQLIGLRVAHAERGAVGGSWRTSGRVAVDETRVHHVNVKFSGFMEKVYADFIGRPVKAGEPLYSIYSPELLAAQQEYLLALDTRKRLAASGGMSTDGDALVAAARRKLELWDVPRSEIARIERTGEATRTLTFYSPAGGVLTKKDVVPGMRVNAGDMPFEIVDLSRVWVLADAYESDLRHVKVGTPATLALKAFPNRTFNGRVAFIDPLLDPKSRTAKVRVEVPNPKGELKPEMFGEVVFQGTSREGVRIPADAVIHSGTKSVVFVARGDGKFQPREVQLGDGDAAFVEVVSGVEAGEGVVTRANFLVDSESRLRASLAALASPDAAAPASAGHAGHGGATAAPPPSSPAPAAAEPAAPAANPHAGHGR